MSAPQPAPPAAVHWHRPTPDPLTWRPCRRYHLEALTPYGGRVQLSTSDVEHTLGHLPPGWVIAP